MVIGVVSAVGLAALVFSCFQSGRAILWMAPSSLEEVEDNSARFGREEGQHSLVGSHWSRSDAVEQTMAAPSKQEVRAWCRMCYGADWHQNNKAARLAEARAALSVPSNFSAPYLGTASRATTTVPSAPKQRKATSQMTTSSRNAAPKQKMTSSQHSNDGGGKMKAMSSSKTVRLLQEDLLKEMSRGDGEGGRTEFIMDILQRLDEVDINLKILSETRIGATVMKLKKDNGVPISVSDAARKLIKKWKSVVEKAEANATTKTDVTLKSTTSGVLNRSTVAKSKASKASKGNVASTKGVQMSQDLSSSSTPRDNANQVNRNEELAWASPKDGPVPANVVDELYKQLKLSLKVSREQFSKAVNDIPAMSQHVVVGSDPSVNSGLVEIIKEEFENESILFATDAPIANANGPHINAFVMDSHVLSTNDCIVTSSNGMIANKPWRAVDRLRQYLTAYMGGFRVAISAVLPLLLSVSITSNPDDPSLLILDGQPAHAREGRDKSIKIMNSGVARISKFSMLYALRTCNVGLVLGDDAKKTLLGEGS